MDRALKHFMIAVGFGHTNSLNAIRQMYKDGKATKDDYAKALQVYTKQTWLRLKVNKGMKLLHFMRDTNIINLIISMRGQETCRALQHNCSMLYIRWLILLQYWYFIL